MNHYGTSLLQDQELRVEDALLHVYNNSIIANNNDCYSHALYKEINYGVPLMILIIMLSRDSPEVHSIIALFNDISATVDKVDAKC